MYFRFKSINPKLLYKTFQMTIWNNFHHWEADTKYTIYCIFSKTRKRYSSFRQHKLLITIPIYVYLNWLCITYELLTFKVETNKFKLIFSSKNSTETISITIFGERRLKYIGVCNRIQFESSKRSYYNSKVSGASNRDTAKQRVGIQ